MSESRDFWVMATAAPSNHCGGVTVFYREAKHFDIEYRRLQGPNFVSFHLVTGGRWWHIVGLYISPRYASTIEDVLASIRDRPYWSETLVAGNLNANLFRS